MTETAVAKIEGETPALPAATSYLEVISRVAADPACDVDKLERLLAMQERVMTHQAKMDYTTALAGLQSELPVIKKRGQIKIGNNSQPYALWEDINDTIKPILQRHGFALSFRTGQDGDKITVTAVLSHKGGHSEETTLPLPSDVSGSKNSVQAVGSTTSYGKRYTAGALLNLTFTDEDDDGIKAGAGPVISEGQRGELLSIIEEKTVTTQKFCERYKIASVADLPEAKFEAAKKALLSTPDKPKGAAQ